jgi:regulator of PEP synthase PpsR (kinase-PPPase family)
MANEQRTVFFISDGTGITTETLGHSLLTQFPDVDFKQVRIPFTVDEDVIRSAVQQINQASRDDGGSAIVFSSIMDETLNGMLHQSDGVVLELFKPFIGVLEEGLGVRHEPLVGKAHALDNPERYEDRMEATNYALNHDDGVSLTYKNADLILVGVSRSGKTPTCLYMALHFGVKSANYPLTEEDLDRQRLPPYLRRYKDKIVGLMIDADRLAQIRETRRPNSRYASMRQCHREIDAAEAMLRAEGIPIFNTTHSSIEEIASRVLLQLGLQREMF